MALTMNGAAEDPAMVIHPAGHSSGSARLPLPGDTLEGTPRPPMNGCGQACRVGRASTDRLAHLGETQGSCHG